jgi:Protein phosphatase 2C
VLRLSFQQQTNTPQRNTACSPRAAVFDGHGGDAAAHWLNDNLHEFVEAALGQCKSPQSALRAAFEVCDAELLTYLESASGEGKLLTGAGSTATVVLANGKRLVVGNAGDSTALLIRKGKEVTLTSAHRVYGKCAARRVLTCASSAQATGNTPFGCIMCATIVMRAIPGGMDYRPRRTSPERSSSLRVHGGLQDGRREGGDRAR